MPEHTGFITYLLASKYFEVFRTNAHNVGVSFMRSMFGKDQGYVVSYRGLEPIFTSLLVLLVVAYLAGEVRGQYRRLNESVVPDETLTLRTFFEAFFGYFYDMTKDVMGAKSAKKYFPIIGGSAAFIFFANVTALLPGFTPPTSSLNVTLGCGLFIFITFNYLGLKENGLGYLKHMGGPVLALFPLIFLIEVISTCVRPLTLAIRLMINMAVDHLVASIFLGMVAFLVPLPLMFLAILVIVVQTLVFCLLSSIYIGLATEHTEEHH
jgi:F-type H+-transporting ATPase subunit a